MMRWMARLLLACVCTMGLLACARDSLNPSGQTTLRVIVQFKQPVAYADAVFVQTLRDQVQAPVQYLSSISADTHVYGLQWPTSQDSAPVLQRLAALPSVARVERDTRAQAH
ncbi:MAG: hypothetical protein HYX43_04970 [Burkholderiales bacterium]|nr:hypothetical protein [Burkholderiales bacterium]